MEMLLGSTEDATSKKTVLSMMVLMHDLTVISELKSHGKTTETPTEAFQGGSNEDKTFQKPQSIHNQRKMPRN